MESRTVRHRIVVSTIAALLVAGALAVPAPTRAAVSPLTGRDQLYVTNSALRTDPEAANVARFGIDPQGRATPTDAVVTGHGARGIVFSAPPGPYGQRFAYVPSQQAGEIERYRVAADGALTFIGATATPEPFGIAIDPTGRTVYVANLDGGQGAGALSAFHVEPTGALTLLNSVDSGAASAKGIAVTPDGRFGYVVHGAPDEAQSAVITGFAISADGSIGVKTAEAAIGASGHRIVITPDGRFAYVTNQEADDAAEIYGFGIGASGALTPVSPEPFESGVWTEGAALTPLGHRLYVTSLGEVGGTPAPVEDGQVRGFDIDPDGRLTEIERVNIGFDPVDLAFGLDGRHLYVVDFSGDPATRPSGSVLVFSVDRAGQLKLVQTISSRGPNPAYQGVAVLRPTGVCPPGC